MSKQRIEGAIAKLCEKNFLVFQKVELGMEIGPQHKIWWGHLQTQKDVIELAPRDHGKATCSATPVLTTKGWKTHGSLEVGDKVFTPEGDQTRVTDIPEQCLIDREVTLSNGTKIKVHPNHEWEVIDRRHSRRGPCVKVLETKELLNQGLFLEGTDKRARWWLPSRKALKYAEKSYEIHPYVLGVWLGDGCGTYGWIIQGGQDKDIIFSEVGRYFDHSKEYEHPKDNVYRRVYPLLSDFLADAGLLRDKNGHHKHIPSLYLQGSVEQRLDLLAGLIDTDGCVEQVTQKGRDYSTQRVRFVNTNERLINDIVELCQGLAFKVTKSKVEPTLSSSGVVGKLPVFTLLITPNLDVPTRLQRKKIEGSRSRDLPRISIVSIEPCDPVPGQCISIEDPRGVYLVGRELIPTHNSMSLSRAYVLWQIKYNPWIKEVMILGADLDSAVQNLDKLKEMAMVSPSLAPLFPEGRRNGINSRTEVLLTNGKRIKTKGWYSPLRGRHPQLIVLDDVLNEKNCWSMESRARTKTYFNEVVVPMKDKGNQKFRSKGFYSQIVVVGTAQDWDDLYHYLLKNNQYLGTKLDCIIDDVNELSLWPDRYSYDDLMAIKERVGSLSFAKEYRNQPLSDETTIFPTSLFMPLFDEHLTYARVHEGTNPVYIGVDFSVPGNSDGDYTVIVALEYDPKENMYTMLNYYRDQPTEIGKQIERIEYFCQAYKATIGFLEDNSFQGIYREHFKKKSNLPLRGHTVNAFNKKSMAHGVLALRPIFENGNFRFPYKTVADKQKTDLIVSEFNGFKQRHGRIGNETSHDDTVMAIWHAYSASRSTIFSADFGY